MVKKILIADDSVTIQKVVRISLPGEEYEVIVADNGEDAVIKMVELMPDIVLADVAMPKMDGYQVCDIAKRNPRTRNIPVILLAGNFEKYDEQKAAAAGAAGHLTKPFESAALLNAVRAALGQRPVEPPFPEEPAPDERESDSMPPRGAKSSSKPANAPFKVVIEEASHRATITWQGRKGGYLLLLMAILAWTAVGALIVKFEILDQDDPVALPYLVCFWGPVELALLAYFFLKPLFKDIITVSPTDLAIRRGFLGLGLSHNYPAAEIGDFKVVEKKGRLSATVFIAFQWRGREFKFCQGRDRDGVEKAAQIIQEMTGVRKGSDPARA